MTDRSPQKSPLIYGFQRFEDGRIVPLDWAEMSSGPAMPTEGFRWMHLDRLSPLSRDWLEGAGGLDAPVVAALFQEDTRPRATPHGDGLLVNLRGVNLNEGADPDDMIAIRIWAAERLLVSTRAFRILAAEDLAARYHAGEPPQTVGGHLAFIADRLVTRIDPVVQSLGLQVDTLEDEMLDEAIKVTKTQLSPLRRAALALRRYMSPQREAVSSLISMPGGLLDDADRAHFRETYDALLRLSEDLEAVRERAQMVQEQIVERRAEEMNARLFVLSIVSVVFLPLGFITGLFGVNIGGMPGVDSPFAFAILCLGMVALTGGLALVFRRIGWI